MQYKIIHFQCVGFFSFRFMLHPGPNPAGKQADAGSKFGDKMQGIAVTCYRPEHG